MCGLSVERRPTKQWKREQPCHSQAYRKQKVHRIVLAHMNTWRMKNCGYFIFDDQRLINSSFIRHVKQKSMSLIEQIRMRAILTEKFKFIVPFRWVLIPFLLLAFVFDLHQPMESEWIFTRQRVHCEGDKEYGTTIKCERFVGMRCLDWIQRKSGQIMIQP